MIESGRFQVRGTSGRTYTVVEYTKMVTWKPLDGPVEKHKGAKELFLDDGRDVTPVSGGRFKIVLTDELLDRI